MSDDDRPKLPPMRIIERNRAKPVTLETVHAELAAHRAEDASNLGKIMAEVAEVKRTQATKADIAEVRAEQATKSQTTKQSAFFAFLLALAELIHRFL